MKEHKKNKLRGLGSRGLSSVADEAGIDRSQLSKLINGSMTCTLKRAVSLCYVINAMCTAAQQEADFTVQDFKPDADGISLEPTHEFWVTDILFRGAGAFTACDLLSKPEFKRNHELMLALYHTVNTYQSGYTWGPWLISAKSAHKPWVSEES
tara:strand:- start:4 stop:462 length:459 start_codon:yes stop_codon:yes gene_type:complete